MPDHLKGLFVILVLATVVFAFARRPSVIFMGAADFTRRRNLWFALTLVAFLSPNFWVYTFIAISLLIYTNRREPNPPALFFFILFTLPPGVIQIPGIGIFNALFELSNPRILELIILLPAFISLRLQNDSFPFGRVGPDKVIAAYLLLSTVLFFRDASVTDTLRKVFYLFFDIFLPYAVFSRSPKNMQAFRDVLLSLVLAVMILALIACAESFKNWLLYQPLNDSLFLGGGVNAYIARGSMLRASASAGHPIILGYLMVVGMGFYLFLQRSFQQKLLRRFGIVLLIAGLFAPLSRGPWVGAVVLLLVFVVTGRNPAPRLIGLGLVAIIAIPLVAVIPGGEKIINLLPFTGETEQENVNYREQLITNSMIVIQRSPWFGSTNFLKTPEMEAMRQGEGIIDVVNTYIAVTLGTGFVGLGLFVAFFTLALHGIYRAMRSISDKDGESYLLGRVLLATLVAIMVIIFTASSILFIPIIYWTVVGLGVAYAQMVRKNSE